MAHLRFNVAGLRGPACQERVEREVQRLPGVWAAVVCLDQGYLDVEYSDDDGPTAEAFIGAVATAGYSARISG